MKIAIVGAGMAGLGAARTLAAAGLSPVVFEKSRNPGGRVHSWSRDGFTWDVGATGIAPGDSPLAAEMEGATRIALPVWVHRDLKVELGDPAREKPKFAYAGGFRDLTRRLATGLDVRYEIEVDRLARHGDGYVLNDERYDAVILTPPVPQTAQLLWTIGESRAIAGARYRACLTLMLGYETPTPDVPYHALLSKGREHPLGWVALESRKVDGRAPDGACALTVQLGARFSQESWGMPDDELLATVSPWLVSLFGPGFARPAVSRVKRWKYSQPESTARFEDANPAGTRLLLAGDGVSAPRAEQAYASGVQAAQRLIPR